MEESKLRELLNSLSIEEKIGQLIQLSGEFFSAKDISVGPQKKLGITKDAVELCGSVLNVVGAKETHRIQDAYLKGKKHPIPLIFMSDIVYGFRTIYPIPLGLGATWNPDLIQKAYRNTAEEAYASGNQVTFAPMVDLARDARWGRSLESTGEDPYLNSRFAASMVKGLQEDLPKYGLVSCVKHFAAYGAVESGREYNATDMSENRLRQYYLPSYKAAVDAGAKMVMSSFNTLNGVPVTGNKWLLKDILRKEWNFDGVIISDYAAIAELVAHGFAKDNQEASKLALEATVDIDMKSPCYANELKPLVTEGKLDESKIDNAVWRVLKLKNDLGLFEDPYRGSSEELEKKLIMTPEKRELAKKVSTEAMVLLKNENNMLPLDKNKKVALIGPYENEHELLGLWAVHGDRKATVTIEDGFKKYLNSDNLFTSKGTDILRNKSIFRSMGLNSEQIDHVVSSKEIEEKNNEDAIETARKADIIVFAAGEHTIESGEAGSRGNLTLPDNQLELLDKLSKLNKPIILICISGRPLILTDVEPKVSAIIEAWFPGTEGGNALADIIFGKSNPSGRLSMSFPYAVGQLPIYYSQFSTGRSVKTSTHSSRFMSKYIDIPNDPLYSFGYGLSYSKVKYSNLRLSSKELEMTDNLIASIDVTNMSDRNTTEVVQMYIQDKFASVVQPVKSLKGFERVTLNPNETKTVNFEINKKMLSFYGLDNKLTVEPGEFNIFIGPNSDVEDFATFNLK
ncbi:beta-glucosidase BglX [Companilactobacillus sp. HBUAS56257]|uniref:beta-glucosidase BglX n=1 Tax=Companilactobacillus sp. HBUAS56257 TaxID=3109360 RepID=UPI002FF00B23